MGKSFTSFKPGQSGNPGGRPKQVVSLIKFCRRRTRKALQLCESLIKGEIDGQVPNFDDPKDRVAFLKVRFEAAKFLASYGMGAVPKYDTRDEGASKGERPTAGLSREQLEAIARARLSSERPDDEPN